jgi:hypothetical protein
MLNRILAISSLVLLTGCAGLPSWNATPVIPEPVIKTVTEYKTLEIYQPPLPQAISLEDVEFFVITEKNKDEKIAELEKMQSGSFVLFGLTPQGYENMAYNLQEIRRYIREQKEIVLYYRKATQEDEDTDSQDWLRKNEELSSDQLTND